MKRRKSASKTGCSLNSLNGKISSSLALIYKEAASSIPADAIGAASSQVSGLVTQIEQIPQDRQLDTLEDIITAGKMTKVR